MISSANDCRIVAFPSTKVSSWLNWRSYAMADFLPASEGSLLIVPTIDSAVGVEPPRGIIA